MIRGIHHIALHTPNIQRMLDFYCNVIGFEVALDHVWEHSQLVDEIIGVPGSGARLVLLRTGNCHLELFQYGSPPPRDAAPLRPHDHGYTHLCLDVVDIETEYDRLTAAGMIFCRRPGDFGDVKAVYGRDPDGNIIEIQETTPDQAVSLKKLKLVSL
jgi:glyoxylase I family protein